MLSTASPKPLPRCGSVVPHNRSAPPPRAGDRAVLQCKQQPQRAVGWFRLRYRPTGFHRGVLAPPRQIRSAAAATDRGWHSWQCGSAMRQRQGRPAATGWQIATVAKVHLALHPLPRSGLQACGMRYARAVLHVVRPAGAAHPYHVPLRAPSARRRFHVPMPARGLLYSSWPVTSS